MSLPWLGIGLDLFTYRRYANIVKTVRIKCESLNAENVNKETLGKEWLL